MKNDIITFFAGCLALLSCNNDSEAPGKLSPIGLEKKEIILTASDSSMVLKTKCTDWFILYGRTIINGDTALLKNSTYTLTTDQVTDVVMYKDTFVGEWFQAIKETSDLKLDIFKNNSSSERTLIIELSGGNKINEQVKIIQKGG